MTWLWTPQKAIQQHAALRAEAAEAMVKGQLPRTQWMSTQQGSKPSRPQGIPQGEIERVIRYALEHPQELYPGDGPPLQPGLQAGEDGRGVDAGSVTMA